MATRRLMRGAREDDHMRALFAWRDAVVNQRGYGAFRHLYHIPNGGKRSKSEAARFKAMGVQPGIPDVHLPVRGLGGAAGRIGLYIEMKSEHGRVSQSQRVQIRGLRIAENVVAVCFHWERAVRVCEWYRALAADRPPEVDAEW